MQVTATEAKNRFGNICAYAKRSPVTVLKGGLPDSVILSFDDYQILKQGDTKSAAQRKREFESTYKDWIASYNADIEKNGVWSEQGMAWGSQPLRG